MKNILIPTDFSAASGNAAKYAVSLAQSFDAEVFLLNVIAPPVIIDDSIFASIIITQAELVTEHEKLMKREIERLSKNHSIKITGLVKEGYALKIIPELAGESHVDLIVMGMKGEGKSSSIFGSTTTSIIRISDLPVLVIPEETVYQPIGVITLASDFDASIEMDRYVVLLALAEKFNSQIKILNVQKGNSFLKPEQALGKMRTSFSFSRHKHEFHTINESKVREGINKFMETNHTDLLAMVAHKHPLFDRLFGRVQTKAMSYETKIPLLVLHSK